MKLEVLIVRLTKKITTTKRVIKRVTNDETGEIVDNEVDEDTITDVADLSQLINVNIFSFAYGKLREKLSIIFGEDNIIDC
jgi:hypothetical protein